MYCDSGLGGWAALCREAGHDTAMPARTHGHDTGLGRAGSRRALDAGRRRSQQARRQLGEWALGDTARAGRRRRRACVGRAVGHSSSWASGRSSLRSGRAGVRSGRAGVHSGRAGVRSGRTAGARTRHGRARARGRRRQGHTGRPAGRPVRVWCAQLGQVGCFGAPNSVFGLV